MKTLSFNYEQAFDRNLGWLSSEEQAILKRSSVAIAGVGGVGGYQAEVLARLGVGHFKLADPDTFELTNFNRQSGAVVETIGQAKVEVIQKRLLGINPDARIEIFQEGLTPSNCDRFLDGVHLAVDGIDFFEVERKFFLFEKGYGKKIPVLTSCPLGFGASIIIFSPFGMKYSSYFDLQPGMNEAAKRMALTYGLSPSPLCLGYMSGKTVDPEAKRASSVAPGLMLVGALTGTEGVKILTGKSKIFSCPHVYQIDLMTRQVRKRYYPLGMASPWQRLRRAIFKRFLKSV